MPWLVVTGAGALLIVSFVTGRVLRRTRRLGLHGDVEVRVLHGDEPDIQYHDDGGHAPAMRVHLETGELVDAIHPGGTTEVEHHE